MKLARVLMAALFFTTTVSFQLHAEDGVAAPIDQLTLKKCIELAFAQSEDLKLSAEDILQAREFISQAVGSVLPDIKWNYNHITQDTSGVGGDSGGVGGTLTQKTREESKFVGRQLLFGGLREYHAVKGYKANVKKLEKELERERITLIGQTAEAFFNVVLYETARRNLQTLHDLTQDRIKELRGRVNLGKSRDSEILTNESQLAGLKAQLVINESRIISAREDLGYLIGRDTRNALLVDVTPRPVETAEAENTLTFIRNRSDVRALEDQIIARRYAVTASKGNYWPKADVLGDYYTKRPGFQSEIDWDVIFNVDVPIFQGGIVKSETDEAKSLLRQAELELERLTRQVGTEIRTAAANLNSSVNEAKYLEEAFDRAKRSYELQVKEYRYGLVNNLEVLQAMNSMQEAKQRLDQSVIQSKVNWIRLQVALEQEI